MSAPSDGARADARKRLSESIGRLEGRGNWYTDAELAGVIADAKAEALREAATAAFADRSIQGLRRVVIGNWIRNLASEQESGR